MGILYLAALIVGAGAIALQLLLGGDAHGGDVHVGDVHVGDVHVGDAHVGAGHDAAHSEPGFLPIFLSLRFWVFGLLAFGMTGTLLHYLELAGRTLTAVAAVALGVLSGFVASFALRLIARTETTSSASADEPLGRVGRVLVPCKKGSRGKVRIELRGQSVDFLATTDEPELEGGAAVLVEDVRDGLVHVSRAPDDLLPPKSGTYSSP